MKRNGDPADFDEKELRVEDDRLCSLHHAWLKQVFIILKGNGDIKHGMEWKVQTLLDNQAIIVKLVWIIVIAVVGKIVSAPIIETIVKVVQHIKG